MTHDRTLDHYGVEDDTTTILSSSIGRYASGAVVHDVLVDLNARLTFIEAYGDVAVVLSFTANAVRFKTGLSFAADAYINTGASSSFTANASLHGTVERSFSANAYFIDNC